jgi:multidrug efflux pump subunit AcrA (membrane-fusion protein)
LIFPVISKIISYIKHRNLIIRLQQEGRIKEILASVGDYVKKSELEVEKEEKEVKKEEVASEAL